MLMTISRQTIIIITPLLTGRCKKSEFFTNALNEVVAVAMVVDCLQVCSAGYLTTCPNTTSTMYTSKHEKIANSKIRLVVE